MMKKLSFLIRPLSIACLSLLIVTSFLRYYLYVNSAQLVKEFKNQNYRELYSLDTLKVSSRLNSLSTAINWVCISASIDNRPFFKMDRGDCQTGLLRQRQQLKILEANNTVVNFTIRLPEEVENLFLLFIALQSILILALIISTKRSEQEKRKIEIQINDLAKQMSHDIRSPLATLNSIMSNVESIPEQDKKLIELAILRINQISNELLKSSKTKELTLINDSQLELEKVNINFLVIEVVQNKKIEFSNLNLNIRYKEIEDEIYCLVKSIDLIRILSNIINNSIDAKDNSREMIIDISVSRVDLDLKIIITDNGIGIKQSVLDGLGKTKITTKKEGNGLGFFDAQRKIISWGGIIEVNSQVNIGTSIEILLPVIYVTKNITILLDDDELVRLTWTSVALKKGINFQAIANVSELESLLPSLSSESTFYIDSNLGLNIKGEAIADEISRKGFKNIFITSGYEQQKFKNLSYLTGVRDKSPPW